MHLKLSVVLFFLGCFLFSQINKKEEKLIRKMCETFQRTSHLDGSERKENMYKKHLDPYLKNIQYDKIDSVAFSISIRFQKACPEYEQFLFDSGMGRNEDAGMVLAKEKPASTITQNQLEELKSKELFSYFDADGVMTWVEIKNGFWTEKFFDNTYSRTKITWHSANRFELQFIESNNDLKQAMSKPGEIYKYEILSKEDKYYWVISIEEEGRLMTKFKLYFVE